MPEFFTITKMFGQRYQGDSTPGIDSRPALVRRVECWHCPHLINNWMPVKDDSGDMKPRYECDLLDVKNQKIYEDNLNRHPQEQLPYFECIWGSLEEWVRKMPQTIQPYY